MPAEPIENAAAVELSVDMNKERPEHGINRFGPTIIRVVILKPSFSGSDLKYSSAAADSLE